MAIGRLTLRRFNGVEEFGLESATMMGLRDEEGSQLWFEARTDGVPLRTLSDTAEFHAHPGAQVAVTLEGIDPGELPGRRFSVSSGYDEAIEDHVASLYYFAHQDLDENEIEITARDGNRFQVHWTGTTTDVSYYDGSKPRTRVEIDGWFTFQDIEDWVSV